MAGEQTSNQEKSTSWVLRNRTALLRLAAGIGAGLLGGAIIRRHESLRPTPDSAMHFSGGVGAQFVRALPDEGNMSPGEAPSPPAQVVEAAMHPQEMTDNMPDSDPTPSPLTQPPSGNNE